MTKWACTRTLEYHDDVHHENGVYLSLRRRLREPNIPTAVFAEDEISALGAERAIAEAGLRVPGRCQRYDLPQRPFYAPGRAPLDGS